MKKFLNWMIILCNLKSFQLSFTLQAWIDLRIRPGVDTVWVISRKTLAGCNTPLMSRDQAGLACAQLISCLWEGVHVQCYNVTLSSNQSLISSGWSEADCPARCCYRDGLQRCSLTSCQAPAIASSLPVARSQSLTGTLQRFLIK